MRVEVVRAVEEAVGAGGEPESTPGGPGAVVVGRVLVPVVSGESHPVVVLQTVACQGGRGEGQLAVGV